MKHQRNFNSQNYFVEEQKNLHYQNFMTYSYQGSVIFI